MRRAGQVPAPSPPNSSRDTAQLPGAQGPSALGPLCRHLLPKADTCSLGRRCQVGSYGVCLGIFPDLYFYGGRGRREAEIRQRPRDRQEKREMGREAGGRHAGMAVKTFVPTQGPAVQVAAICRAALGHRSSAQLSFPLPAVEPGQLLLSSLSSLSSSVQPTW